MSDATVREAAERAARELLLGAPDAHCPGHMAVELGHLITIYLRGRAEGRAPLLAALREIHRAYIASESTALGEAIEAAAALAAEPAAKPEGQP